MHVQASVEWIEGAPQHGLGQCIPIDHFSRRTHQRLEQSELDIGKLQSRAVLHDPARGRIQFQILNAQDFLFGNGRAGVAAQNRTHAGQQFARIEGLGQIVVGSELETDDAVHIFSARRQQQDVHRRLGANPFQHLEAVYARQHYIEQNQPPSPLLRRLQPGVAAMRGLDAEAVLAQIFNEHRAEFHIIVDQEYFFHACPHL